MTMIVTRCTAAALAAAMLLSGCATTQQASGGDPCNTVGTAVAGALVGALVGAAVGGRQSAAKGGAAGAAIGALACIAINSQSRQTKSAAVVEQDYLRARGTLPAQPQLSSYQTRVDPTGTIRPGMEVRVRTNVEVVRGSSMPVREVKEEIVLYDTENAEFKRAAKVLNQGSGGSYETDWQFKLPSGVTQGQYTVRTFMYVNGQQLAQRETRMQLVLADDGVRLAELAQ